ncbi:MAG: phage major capsid protein [Acidobacteriota bacterium]
MQELITELKTYQTNLDAKLAEVATRFEKRVDAIEAAMSRGDYGGEPGGQEQKDFAGLLWNSDGFEVWRKSARGRFAVHLTPAQYKSAIVSSDFAATSSNFSADRQTGIVATPTRRLRVRDLMPNFPTSAGLIEYLRETSFTNAASPVAETVSKPESSVNFSIEVAPVRTVAHMLPIAKQAMDDISALRAYLGKRLTAKLLDIEDVELLSGDGTGQHVEGLLALATSYQTGRDQVGDTRLDKLSHAFCQLEETEFQPTGIVLNPYDWRRITLLKTEEGGANKGSYLAGSPLISVGPNVWGVPVAATTALPRGYFLVADFDQACAVFNRQPPTIEISDSHADYFQRNMLAVRCEERISLAMWNAGGLVYGAF